MRHLEKFRDLDCQLRGFCWCYWGRPGVPRGDSVYKPKRHTSEGRAVECRKQMEEKQDKTHYCLREKGKRPQRNEKGLELCQAMDSS